MHKRLALLLIITILLSPISARTANLAQEIKSQSLPSTLDNRESMQKTSTDATPEGQDALGDKVRPFGAEMFRGRFSKESSTSPDPSYIIAPGDNITIQVFGAVNQDGSQVVDAQGNVFLPAVGPVRLAGVTVRDLNKTVRSAISRVFTSNVEVYTNLQKPLPVAVFVTGFVSNPGSYTGSTRDSVLYYLDRAGGINLRNGSFRDIRLMRGDKLIAKYDLYDFLLNGRLNQTRIEEGDVIVVGPKGPTVIAMGDVGKQAAFEWSEATDTALTGKTLENWAKPQPSVSHAAVSGTRNGTPFQNYLPLAAAGAFALADGDTVTFLSDVLNPTITVNVRGAQHGPSVIPVSRSKRLQEVLAQIPIDIATADLKGIHILRKRVADQQTKALQEALYRLEKAVITPSSSTGDEAQIRVREAELVSRFVERAKHIRPDGLIVVTEGEQISDISLETGDVIVIPQKTDVVLISGEVKVPASVVYTKGRSLDDYIRMAGGLTDRSSKDILIVRANGKVEMNPRSVGPGDHIQVMPNVDIKILPILKDLAQVIYQVAIGARMVDLLTQK